LENELITTWKGIADYLKISIRTLQRRKNELRKNGVIFYRKKGRPPRIEVAAFKSRLIDFFGSG